MRLLLLILRQPLLDKKIMRTKLSMNKKPIIEYKNIQKEPGERAYAFSNAQIAANFVIEIAEKTNVLPRTVTRGTMHYVYVKE